MRVKSVTRGRYHWRLSDIMFILCLSYVYYNAEDGKEDADKHIPPNRHSATWRFGFWLFDPMGNIFTTWQDGKTAFFDS